MIDDRPVLMSCPTCNAPLEYDGVHSVVHCKFCGNTSVVPSAALNGQPPSSELEEIIRLTRGGQYGAAAERFRAAFGEEAEDAQEAVDALASGSNVVTFSSGQATAEELADAMQQVQRLAASGNRIEAVKVYRQTFGTDLSDSVRVVDQIIAWATQQGLPSTLTIDMNANNARLRRAAWITGLAILFFIIGVGVVIALAIGGGKLAPHYIAMQDNLLLPAADGAPSQVASYFYDPNSDTRFAGLVDAASGKLLWKTEPLPETTVTFAAGQGLLYAASGATLLAYHTADGSVGWRTQMSDQAGYGDVPMLVTAGRVIVLTADRRVTAYDAQTGSQSWTRALEGYEDNLRLMDDALAVRDYAPGTYDMSLYLLNPVTGSEVRVLTPLCNTHGWDDHIDSTTGLVHDPAREVLYVIFPQGCLQRITLATGALDWNTVDENTFNYLYQDFTPLLTADSLYFDNGGDLVRVRTADGQEQILLSNSDYETVPLAEVDGTLLARAKRTRGTVQFELWAVDVTSGKIAWQRNLQPAEPIDPPDEMVGLVTDTDWAVTWRLTDAGLVLLTFRGEPNQLTLERLNLADGTSLGSQTLDLKGVVGDFYGIPQVFAWQGNLAYLNIDNDLYTLDILSGELKTIY